MQVETACTVMEADVYDELIADPYRFIRNVVRTQKIWIDAHALLQESNAKYEAIDYYFRFGHSEHPPSPASKTNTDAISRGGVFWIRSICYWFTSAILRAPCLNIKRNPNKVAEACEALLAHRYRAVR
jgi:hypothetical protein